MGVAPRPVWGWPNVTPNRGATPNHLHGPWGWPRAKMGVAETTPKSLGGGSATLVWPGLAPRPVWSPKKKKKMLGFGHGQEPKRKEKIKNC